MSTYPVKEKQLLSFWSVLMCRFLEFWNNKIVNIITWICITFLDGLLNALLWTIKYVSSHGEQSMCVREQTGEGRNTSRRSRGGKEREVGGEKYLDLTDRECGQHEQIVIFFETPSLHSFTTANISASISFTVSTVQSTYKKWKIFKAGFSQPQWSWGNGITYEFLFIAPVWNVPLQGLLTSWIRIAIVSVESMASSFR